MVDLNDLRTEHSGQSGLLLLAAKFPLLAALVVIEDADVLDLFHEPLLTASLVTGPPCLGSHCSAGVRLAPLVDALDQQASTVRV